MQPSTDEGTTFSKASDFATGCAVRRVRDGKLSSGQQCGTDSIHSVKAARVLVRGPHRLQVCVRDKGNLQAKENYNLMSKNS